MTIQTINLNMIPGGVMPVVYCSQYDNQTNAIIFKLYNGSETFNVPQGAAVLINGTKPPVDGEVTGFSYSAASISGNTVVCNVTTQMAAVIGDVLCELRIRTSTQIVGSINFILRVERSALNDDTVLSETEIPLIEQAIEIAADLADYIQTAVDSAETASSAAETATEAATQSAIINTNVEGIYDDLTDATAAANAAAQAANAAAETLEDITATATTLSPGSSATASYNSSTGVMTFGIPQGATGASGVTTPISGFYSLYVDADGNLFVVYSDTDDPPAFYYDDETGNLYVFTGSVIRESTGEVITISGGVDFHALSASTTIEAQQSGTGDPSPSNVRPITGWTQANVTRCGKNLYNYATVTANTYLKSDGTTGSSTTFVLSDYIRCSEGTYSFSGCPNGFGTSPRVGFYDFNKTFLSSTRITSTSGGQLIVPNGTEYTRISVSAADKTTFQLETGSAITSFEAYNGTTYTVSFGSAGTVYGGTLDVTTGVLTVNTVGVVFDGTEEWGTGGSGTSKLFRYIYSGVVASDGSGAATPRACSHYPNASITSSTTSQGFMAYTSTSSPNDMWMHFRPNLSTIADATAWKSFLATQYANGTPVTAIAEIASPQTFALTPTQILLLQGVNNIWSDTGTLTLKYIEEV